MHRIFYRTEGVYRATLHRCAHLPLGVYSRWVESPAQAIPSPPTQFMVGRGCLGVWHTTVGMGIRLK